MNGVSGAPLIPSKPVSLSISALNSVNRDKKRNGVSWIVSYGTASKRCDCSGAQMIVADLVKFGKAIIYGM